MKNVILFLIVIILLTACGRTTGGAESIIEKEETNLFTLEVSIDQIPSSGESLTVTSTLTYKGEKEINLMHGEPIVRTAVKDAADDSEIQPMMYTAVMAETKIEPGHIFKEERSIDIEREGGYLIEVATTTLFDNDQALGKVSIEPISIEVN